MLFNFLYSLPLNFLKLLLLPINFLIFLGKSYQEYQLVRYIFHFLTFHSFIYFNVDQEQSLKISAFMTVLLIIMYGIKNILFMTGFSFIQSICFIALYFITFLSFMLNIKLNKIFQNKSTEELTKDGKLKTYLPVICSFLSLSFILHL